ncbi:hypothetical protein B9W90_22610 [Salmonella enterica subsp. enterica]|nr:hypothetical protein [Salmonella enterica subsp. enterica]
MLAFWHEYSDLISAFLAALLGGWFTMKGVTAQVKQQAKQQTTAAREKRITTLLGVREEIDSLIKLYQARMAEEIENTTGTHRSITFSPLLKTTSRSMKPIRHPYLKFIEKHSQKLWLFIQAQEA